MSVRLLVHELSTHFSTPKAKISGAGRCAVSVGVVGNYRFEGRREGECQQAASSRHQKSAIVSSAKWVDIITTWTFKSSVKLIGQVSWVDFPIICARRKTRKSLWSLATRKNYILWRPCDVVGLQESQLLRALQTLHQQRGLKSLHIPRGGPPTTIADKNTNLSVRSSECVVLFYVVFFFYCCCFGVSQKWRFFFFYQQCVINGPWLSLSLSLSLTRSSVALCVCVTPLLSFSHPLFFPFAHAWRSLSFLHTRCLSHPCMYVCVLFVSIYRRSNCLLFYHYYYFLLDFNLLS